MSPFESEIAEARIASLERKFDTMEAALGARIVQLEEQLEDVSRQPLNQPTRGGESAVDTLNTISRTDKSGAGPATDETGVRSRRDLLKRGGVGVAAAAAGMAALATPAAAADGDNVILGQNNTATSGTALSGSSVSNANILTVSNQSVGSAFPSAVGAYAYTADQANGVYAYVTFRDNADTNTGHSILSYATASGRSNILLRGTLPDPRSTAFAHRVGEMTATQDGSLWYCVVDGTPGTWRKIAGSSTAGAFHPITPKRVWDTRHQGGVMTNGESRVVSVADGRALGSSTVDQANLVPDGASAIAMNLAVVNTSASGFMAVTPGDAAEYSAASINWSQANSVLNNGTMSTIDGDREVAVWCQGSGHFIIDVTGYWL